MLNIGIVCYPTFGGSGVVATELGKALAEKGYQVHFISYSRPARLDFFTENLFYHEVSVSNYPLFEYPPYETALASKLVDIALFANLDILHVHYAIPHASAAVMAKQILAKQGKQISVVTTLHGTDITLVGKDATYEPVVSYSINESDAVTSVSQNLKEQTYSYFHVDKDIHVVPNFIDFQRFSKKPKEHFKKAIAPYGERILIHTSNFRKVKRVDDVIRIFSLLKDKIPAKLLLIGDGPERMNIEKICRDLDICERVTFLGKQEMVEEILSVGDLFLLPSESDSFGLAALEAMACQVPVISTNSGGIPELNVHGFTGFNSEVGDVEDMAKNALYILEDDERLAQFKANAFEHAHQFEIDKILKNYEAIYASVVALQKA
ncbi:MAG: N-acetyl-alpha-D-glucosaminyl L-malate synthase BshA [Bacteroidota bacterium]|nr:N-acetyl-alpha-D-glucosaminyl L-malate synthase BshA [Bacteroidota bacterium]MDX5431001.1 N-acetyl-alpha-D-glucosaminyl L-malate synthase BshA [Bacteroidota bacterium]MDX5469752.1 N-acetyl-alpha-D-glucosaminyl L-malate synthase BshA [Bacteroidota bacterium]